MVENLVSCVVPTYKRSDSLDRAIESILNQTYKQFEILIVDDNEPDDEYSKTVKKRLEKYSSYSNVIYLSQGKHVNGASARNYGILRAKGEFIAFLDDDDEWLPTKLEKQIHYLKQHPQYDGCSCYISEFSKGKLIRSAKPYTTDNILLKIFTREVGIGTPTLLLKKECLLDAGLFDVNLKRHQELQLLIYFTYKYSLGVYPEHLVNVHIDSAINHPNIERFIEIKKDFFHSVHEMYAAFNKHDQKTIKSAHLYEIIFAALKQKRWDIAFKYILKTPIDFKSYKILYKRFINRTNKNQN